MTKRITDKLGLFIGSALLLLICAMVLFPMKASAKAWPHLEPDYEFSEFEWGEVIDEDALEHTNMIYGGDTAAPNLRLAFNFQTKEPENIELIVAEMGCTCLATKEDFTCKYDKKTKVYTYTYAYVSKQKAGTLYQFTVVNRTSSPIPFKLCVTQEPVISLARTTILEMTNTKSHTMTVKYEPVKKRLGYQIEYADNSKFNNKTRVNTGASQKDIGKLTIGKTYYVRVRTYARYADGTLVYSKWSGTRKIKIKK